MIETVSLQQEEETPVTSLSMFTKGEGRSEKAAVYKTRGLTRNQSWHLVLGLPAVRTVRE